MLDAVLFKCESIRKPCLESCLRDNGSVPKIFYQFICSHEHSSFDQLFNKLITSCIKAHTDGKFFP